MGEQVFIGLLRGINVGGKVLKMADLQSAIAGLGFGDVRTYLQSGNMVFRTGESDSATLAARIAKAIADGNGMDVQVMIRSAKAWDGVVSDNPFPAAVETPKLLHAFILGQQPEESRATDLQGKDFGSEAWRIVGDVLYLHTPDGFGKSRLGNAIERLLKVPMTGRNWTTVMALQLMSHEF